MLTVLNNSWKILALFCKGEFMNLYKHTFEHYSQKDSKGGIEKYFLAENNADAYNIIYGNFGSLYEGDINSGFDSETYESDSPEQAKNRVIAAGGDLNLSPEYTEYMFSDLYYGLTLEGWELVKANITRHELEILAELGIVKENT